MSTNPNPVASPTEAHHQLVKKIADWRTPFDHAARLIAESEARAVEALRADLALYKRLYEQRNKEHTETLAEAVKVEEERNRLREELDKLRRFYDEIVAECGHDLIVREYRQRGELLRDEAKRRKDAEAERDQLRAALHDLVTMIECHEIESLGCDRDGEEYCNCLRDMAKKAKKLV